MLPSHRDLNWNMLPSHRDFNWNMLPSHRDLNWNMLPSHPDLNWTINFVLFYDILEQTKSFNSFYLNAIKSLCIRNLI